MSEQNLIKTSVNTLYMLQKVRIQHGNRIAAAYRQKLGLTSSQAEEANDDAHEILETLRKEFKRITDGIKRVTKNVKTDSTLITSYGELMMLSAYEKQLESEADHEKYITNMLETQPIFTEFLEGVRGVGPKMAAVIVAEIDIHKCNSISALWKYAGLDVVVTEEFGEEGRCRKKHHLTNKEMIGRDGEKTEFMGITFNPFLKTKMIGVLGASFIKAGGIYRDIYVNYKHRLQNNPKHSGKTKGHIHNMAIRYMIKEFLADLWTKWRELEGLPVRARYNEEKLGIVHSKKAA